MQAPAEAFWNPRILRGIGFTTADRTQRRFFGYCEVLRHVEEAAWDPRSVWVRVDADIRRDFAWTVAALPHKPGGTIAFERPEVEIGPPLRDRIAEAEAVVQKFELLLREQAGDREETFHAFLKGQPILLDLYASTAVSKPRWSYPESRQAQKQYVEPDFVLAYGGGRYCLVELEKPGHRLKTESGDPRQAVGHAAYQIAEWREYISKHPDLLQDLFPGLRAGNFRTMMVIGRSDSDFDSETSKNEYLNLLRLQFQVEDIYTYDDLIRRARVALTRLSALTILS
jgi:hypothetical protein